MNRYWLRITLGILLVFVLGVSAMAAVRKGKSEVNQFLAKVGTRVPLQLANLKFRFEGRTIGAIKGIDITRTGPDDPGRVTVLVDLTIDRAIDLVRGCTLTIDDLTHLHSGTGFRCADRAELEAGDLVKSGEVVFEPGAVIRPLLLLRRDVDRWRRSDIRSLDASLGPQRGSFTLQADSQGAVISVRDDAGRPLVDFRADLNGVNLNIRDRHGRNLVKLLADSLGAALHVRRH